MILGLHHTAIATRNIQQLSDFYITLFGLSKIAEHKWSDSPSIDEIVGIRNSAAHFMLLSTGNQVLELFEFSFPEPKPGNPDRSVADCGITHICFAVRDIQQEYERLTAAGMSFHAPPVAAGDFPQSAIYGRDPDGNIVELLEICGVSSFDYEPTKPIWRK